MSNSNPRDPWPMFCVVDCWARRMYPDCWYAEVVVWLSGRRYSSLAVLRVEEIPPAVLREERGNLWDTMNRVVREWAASVYPHNKRVEIVVYPTDRDEEPSRFRVPEQFLQVVTIQYEEPWWHNDDYSKIRWFGERFDLTPLRARVVRLIDEARQRDVPELPEDEILQKVGSMSDRLVDIFQAKRIPKFLGRVLVKGLGGGWKINETPPDTPTDTTD